MAAGLIWVELREGVSEVSPKGVAISGNPRV